MIVYKSIVLSPDCLDANILNHAKSAALAFVGQCTQEDGYITKIHKIRISDTMVSRACTNIILRLELDIEALKPEIGQTYKCIVSSCIPGHGIYAHCQGKLKMLVMEQHLKSHVFKSGYCENTITKHEIHVGDEISINVTAIKYDKNNFQCIGVIV